MLTGTPVLKVMYTVTYSFESSHFISEKNILQVLVGDFSLEVQMRNHVEACLTRNSPTYFELGFPLRMLQKLRHTLQKNRQEHEFGLLSKVSGI